MKIKFFYKLLFLEVVALVLVSAYFLINSSDVYSWYVGNTSFSKQDPTCNLHKKACSVKLKDGSIMNLSIIPRSIPLMQPITLRVKTKNIDLNKLDVKIYATNMNMGFNEFSLKKIDENIYEGNTTLPSCIVGNMIWDVNIIANKPTKSLGAIFEFKTGK